MEATKAIQRGLGQWACGRVMPGSTSPLLVTTAHQLSGWQEQNLIPNGRLVSQVVG